MMAAHCSWLMALVPESVRRSIMTWSDLRANTLYPASLIHCSLSSWVDIRIGSTTLIRNGSNKIGFMGRKVPDLFLIYRSLSRKKEPLQGALLDVFTRSVHRLVARFREVNESFWSGVRPPEILLRSGKLCGSPQFRRFLLLGG